MATNFKELEKEIRALSSREKAALARTLIEELDTTSDLDADRLWIEEAQRRYDAFKTGELKTIQGEEAVQRARQRIK